jgi:hypothetical protein
MDGIELIKILEGDTRDRFWLIDKKHYIVTRYGQDGRVVNLGHVAAYSANEDGSLLVRQEIYKLGGLWNGNLDHGIVIKEVAKLLRSV